MSLRPHYQATLKVGWPIAVGQIGTIMVGFTDTLMVGHYNTPSLAAASFVNSVFNLFLFLTMGYSYGLTPLAGRLFGQVPCSRRPSAPTPSTASSLLSACCWCTARSATWDKTPNCCRSSARTS